MKKAFIEKERKQGQQIEVGMGATGSYWTDAYAYEVVRVVSDKTVEIRRLDVVRKEGTDWLDEEYDYFSNDENPVERVRRCKTGWKTKHGMKVRFGHAQEYRDPCL